MEENLGNSEAINQLETTEEEIAEGTSWECSVCTYKNNSEAFKCLMCDVRKGTSTRKPRLNQQIVAQQVAQQFSPAAVHGKKPGSKKTPRKFRPRLKNVDRNSAQEISVTVGNVTVIITDYKLLQSDDRRILAESLLSNSASDDSLEGSAIIYPDVNQKGQIGSVET